MCVPLSGERFQIQLPVSEGGVQLCIAFHKAAVAVNKALEWFEFWDAVGIAIWPEPQTYADLRKDP